MYRLCQYFQRFTYRLQPTGIFAFLFASPSSSLSLLRKTPPYHIRRVSFVLFVLFILLVLPRYMGSADENSQEQHLARSYSFELRPNHFPLPSVDYTPPCVRYPTSEQRHAMERSQRSSSTNGLVNSAMIGSQVSLPNRKVNVSRSRTSNEH